MKKDVLQYAENMQALAEMLENLFPNAGFALMLFDQDSSGEDQMRFISNCRDSKPESCNESGNCAARDCFEDVTLMIFSLMEHFLWYFNVNFMSSAFPIKR